MDFMAGIGVEGTGIGLGYQKSMFQKRLEEIQAMPDGPAKDEEIRKLAMDYPGMLEDLQKSREFGEGLATGESPRGGVAGPASNPFSYYVAASPVEHAAAGAQKYVGWKERQKSMDEIAKTRRAMENETFKLLKAGASDPALQQQQAGLLRGIGIPGTGIGVEGEDYLTPEEKRKKAAARMAALFGG